VGEEIAETDREGETIEAASTEQPNSKSCLSSQKRAEHPFVCICIEKHLRKEKKNKNKRNRYRSAVLKISESALRYGKKKDRQGRSELNSQASVVLYSGKTNAAPTSVD
jgi:hypothetical protein